MDTEQYVRRIYDTARLDLARTRIAGFAQLEAAFARASSISASTLEVARVGVWVMARGGAEIRCLHQHERGSNHAVAAEVLDVTALPRYRAALESRRAIVAHDARTDPLTSELAGYLARHGITSMLDVPIFREGDLFGVVCHEHVGPPRRWTEREEFFAASVADIVNLFFEIAARLHAEARLREAETRLRKAQRVEALGLFAGGLAHDFNNLLAIVSTCGQSLLRAAARHPEIASDARGVVDAAARGTTLVRELSQFTRRAGEAAMQRVDVAATVAARLAMLQLAAGDGVRVELRGRPSGALWARGTADDLERVLINLVTNARDAMPGGGTVTIALDAMTVLDDDDGGATAPGEYVVIAVSDTGIGMSDEVRARAFDPLFTTKTEGTGLGLAVALAIVTQAGGAMRVESQPGRGTTFRVYLPRATP